MPSTRRHNDDDGSSRTLATRARRGFTLIESIVAVVVLAIAVPPMLWAITEAHYQRADHVLVSRARWLAVEKLEDIVADRNSTTRGYAYLIGANYPAEPVVAGYANFGRSVALVETEADLATAGTGYMNVYVTVTWSDSTGTPRAMTVRTVLTEYTP